MKKWLILLAGVFLIIITGSYILFSKDTQPSVAPINTTAFHDNTTGVSLKYPEKLEAAALNEQDKKDRILLRLQQSGSIDMPLLVTLRYEDGIRQTANLLKREPLDIILDSIDKSYPQRFPDFQKNDQKRLEINGRKAAEVTFTYKRNNVGEKLKQRLLIIMKDDDVAIYLAAQSTEQHFATANQTYFEPMFTSITF